MTHTGRFTHRFASLTRRSRTGRGPSRSHTPQHEAFALGLGCARTRLGAQAEWR